MTAAAGLRLLPHDGRNSLHTTTYGVGQLIKLALCEGVEEILLGCGDSGTCGGGVGMAQALGQGFMLRMDKRSLQGVVEVTCRPWRRSIFHKLTIISGTFQSRLLATGTTYYAEPGALLECLDRRRVLPPATL